jgi:mannose-6-phosphate isomerase-like protein (cupin superfamily)
MKLQVLGLGLVSVLPFLPACQETPTTPLTEVTRFDELYGAAPAADWKWGLAAITTGAQEVTDTTNSHNFAWVFYVLRGSAEIGSATGRQALSAGQAAIVPARQDHTHRFAPQTQVLVFRPADRPFGDFHRGTRLYESSALPVTAGRSYRVRIREQTLSAGAQSAVTSETGFGYVVEGPLVVRAGGAEGMQQTGAAFGLASQGQVLLSAGGTPASVVLVDLY